MNDPRMELVRRLREVTESQIDSARALRHQDLDALNSRHSDLLFQLRVAMQEPLPHDAEQLKALKEEVHALGRSQERLALLAGSVVAILDRVIPNQFGSPGTYGRHGMLQAG